MKNVPLVGIFSYFCFVAGRDRTVGPPFLRSEATTIMDGLDRRERRSPTADPGYYNLGTFSSKIILAVLFYFIEFFFGGGN